MSKNSYEWSSEEKINSLNRVPFEKSIISQWADIIIAVAHNHLAKARTESDLQLWDYPGAGEPGHQGHCGQGISYRDSKFILSHSNEGYLNLSSPLATWSLKEDFIEFFSRQSDYSCSGADTTATLFYTENKWEINNQTIKLKDIQKYIERHKNQLLK